MVLSSTWFGSDPHFKQCLTSDAHHIKSGDRGEHVLILQAALMQLDGLVIAEAELRSQSYGPSTADAVLAYKTARKIINPAYQNKPDNIVGKMTIARLDADMVDLEHRPRRFGFGPTSKMVVLTEANPPWARWADQLVKADPVRRTKVTVSGKVSSEALVSAYQSACAQAGPRGVLILSVGHGGGSATGFNTEGILDLAPQRAFRMAGANSVLPGDDSKSGNKPADTSCFYDLRIPNPILKGGFEKSRLDQDLVSSSAMAAVRLKNWRTYEKIFTVIKSSNLAAVLLLTCKMGIATGFMQRISSQFGAPLIGYRRRVAGGEAVNGRARVFLEGDAPGLGTNVPMAEVFFPLSLDMMVIPKS